MSKIAKEAIRAANKFIVIFDKKPPCMKVHFIAAARLHERFKIAYVFTPLDDALTCAEFNNASGIILLGKTNGLYCGQKKQIVPVINRITNKHVRAAKEDYNPDDMPQKLELAQQLIKNGQSLVLANAEEEKILERLTNNPEAQSTIFISHEKETEVMGRHKLDPHKLTQTVLQY